MPSVAVLLPVLDRPQAVEPLVETLERSTVLERSEGWNVRAVFVTSPGDDAEHEAVMDARDHAAIDVSAVCTTWPAGPGDYARKINLAASLSPADWFFTGADDLRFHPGWLRAAVGRHVHTGALVIGTNDLGNPYVMRGLYATHLLVHRDYLVRGTIDEPGKLMHEGYDHNCCDTELVETAKSRGTFAFAKDAHVEHMHPSWRKGVEDATYRKGRANHAADRQLIAERRPLWGGAHVGYRGRRVRQPMTRAARLQR